MLEVKDLAFSYGSREVLKGISFDVRENEIVSILGPNGTGKTTLLNCICNFNTKWGGSVTIDGRDVRGVGPRELAKLIGYVPQKCYPRRVTVFDSVLIGRRPYIEWSATKEDLEMTWDVIESMDLQDIALKYADEISGGELQKVQIARAIVQNPKIIILDEPTNNLDIHNQHMTMKTVFDAVSKRGISTIMTMHDINLAAHYSDNLMFMKAGNICGYGGSEIVDEELIRDVYGMDVDIISHDGTRLVVPKFSDDVREHKKLFHPADD